ncbi:hypothetical protein AMECASPLE_008862 [Ameca splendens]|uniref:Uncharacterized protein n=1 Tax=Ameca splendens TaxID=208324 RepID=A0ABV0YBH2_9TELE
MDSLQSFISSFTRLQFCYISISSSPFRQRSTCSLAPPTDIHHRNARPGSSLRVRCITSFSFLNRFLIHMPFKHAVFPTPLLHSGRSYTPMLPTSHSGSAPNPAGAAH